MMGEVDWMWFAVPLQQIQQEYVHGAPMVPQQQMVEQEYMQEHMQNEQFNGGEGHWEGRDNNMNEDGDGENGDHMVDGENGAGERLLQALRPGERLRADAPPFAPPC
eukprot:3835139-Alexandrium_andersonii.AAC.1